MLKEETKPMYSGSPYSQTIYSCSECGEVFVVRAPCDWHRSEQLKYKAKHLNDVHEAEQYCSAYWNTSYVQD